MESGTTVLLSFAAGAVLLLGGGLIMYMGNLIKAGYDLKIQITNEMEERLTKITEEVEKKSRWVKRDLLEEIERIRSAMQADNIHRVEELADILNERVNGLGTKLENKCMQQLDTLNMDRQLLSSMDIRTKALSKKLNKLEETLSDNFKLPLSEVETNLPNPLNDSPTAEILDIKEATRLEVPTPQTASMSGKITTTST